MSEQHTKNYTNSVTLIGNLGAEALDRVSNSTGVNFTVASLYTQKRYKDENDEYQSLASILHDLIAFNPRVMADLKAFKAGARIKVIGEITYQPLDVILDGKEVKINQTSIVVKKVEPATLFRKQNFQERALEVDTAPNNQHENHVQMNSTSN